MLKKFSVMNSPKKWEFRDPDTKREFVGSSLHDVAAKVRAYRSQNDLSVLDYLENVIENYLCGKPENKGSCEPLPKLKRGLFPSIKGGIVVLTNLMYKSFASQELADERSAICRECPHNIFPDKGPFIQWSDEIALHSIGDRRSKYHDELGNCYICTCPLRPKVFFTGDLNLKKEELEQMPDFCWQKRESAK